MKTNVTTGRAIPNLELVYERLREEDESAVVLIHPGTQLLQPRVRITKRWLNNKLLNGTVQEFFKTSQ